MNTSASVRPGRVPGEWANPERLRRAFVVSLALHLVCLIAAATVNRERFVVPRAMDAIPVRLVSMPAPRPGLTRRETAAPAKTPDVMPDPSTKKEKTRPKPKEKPRPDAQKTATKKAEEKPQTLLPKQGAADTTRVAESRLPAVGDMKGVVQLRAEGGNLPYSYYLTVVQNKIASYWEPPLGLDAIADEVGAVVWFRIDRDGSVPTRHVEEPSGLSSFDASALGALDRAHPLPPLPEEYPDDYLILHLRFVYRR